MSIISIAGNGHASVDEVLALAEELREGVNQLHQFCGIDRELEPIETPEPVTTRARELNPEAWT